MGIATLDITIVAIYTLIILAFGWYLSRRESADDFFINSRKTKLWLLIFTVLSTTVGSGTLIAIASAGHTSGISLGLSFIILSIIGWTVMALLAPRIKKWADKNNAYTLGDFFANRYSSRTRRSGSIVILAVYLTLTAVQFVAAARLIEILVGIDFILALIIGAVITVVYTALSGIKGDFYTDAIQFFVIFPIFILLLWKGFSVVSFSELRTTLPTGHLDPYNYAGPVVFYASVLVGFILLVSSMDIWQRIYAAFDGKTARKAFIASGVLKILAISGAVLIGILSVQIVPGIEPDQAVFGMMQKLLPTGLMGLGLASILAILMSTVDSMIMVDSSTITKDFYSVHRPNADKKKILQIGRIAAVTFGLTALIVAVIGPSLTRLALSAVQLIGVLAPALLGGLLWKRVNDKAAFWSITLGFVFTLVALPFIPDFAFLPGFSGSLIIFFILVGLNKNKENISSVEA